MEIHPNKRTKILAFLRDCPDGRVGMEFIPIDSMIARARQAAAGAPLKRGGVPRPRKKQRRFSTKINLTVDKRGKPLRFILMGGE